MHRYELIALACISSQSGLSMGNQKLVEHNLAKAKEAQALADGIPSQDSFFKTSWLAIAEAYRTLVEAEQSSAASSDSPSPAPPSAQN